MNTTGSNNTAVGYFAGGAWNDGDHNIALGRRAIGSQFDTGMIRIGGYDFQSQTFIEGIAGGSVAGDPVCIPTDDELGECPEISSHRFKQDIESVNVRSHSLSALRPVSFRYRPEVLGEAEPSLRDGLIAEEVAEVLPHLVSYDEEGKPYKVHYQMLTALLLAEVQRQGAEMAVLRRQMAERDRAVADLSERLDRLLKKPERFQRQGTSTKAPPGG